MLAKVKAGGLDLSFQRVYQPWNRVKAIAEIRAPDDDSLTAKDDR